MHMKTYLLFFAILISLPGIAQVEDDPILRELNKPDRLPQSDLMSTMYWCLNSNYNLSSYEGEAMLAVIDRREDAAAMCAKVMVTIRILDSLNPAVLNAAAQLYREYYDEPGCRYMSEEIYAGMAYLKKHMSAGDGYLLEMLAASGAYQGDNVYQDLDLEVKHILEDARKRETSCKVHNLARVIQSLERTIILGKCYEPYQVSLEQKEQ